MSGAAVGAGIATAAGFTAASSIALGGVIGATVATGATALAGGGSGGVAGAIAGAVQGGGGQPQPVSSQSPSSNGNLNFQQAQMAQSIHYNQGPQFGGSKEPQIDSPVQRSTPGKKGQAATKWQINDTPSTGQGEEQAKQDSNNIWADRLSKYLDYNSRQLG